MVSIESDNDCTVGSELSQLAQPWHMPLACMNWLVVNTKGASKHEPRVSVCC